MAKLCKQVFQAVEVQAIILYVTIIWKHLHAREQVSLTLKIHLETSKYALKHTHTHTHTYTYTHTDRLHENKMQLGNTHLQKTLKTYKLRDV